MYLPFARFVIARFKRKFSLFSAKWLAIDFSFALNRTKQLLSMPPFRIVTLISQNRNQNIIITRHLLIEPMLTIITCVLIWFSSLLFFYVPFIKLHRLFLCHSLTFCVFTIFVLWFLLSFWLLFIWFCCSVIIACNNSVYYAPNQRKYYVLCLIEIVTFEKYFVF